jgi:hypothetical protein
LHVDVDCSFARSPDSWRYARRRVLAEECDLRASTDASWQLPECATPEWLARRRAIETLEHGDVASIYRSLRKALEDHKGELGAADFYYGEMEMRRFTKSDSAAKASRSEKLAVLGERSTLGAYWLVSGYGLRASRALIALLSTVLLFALALFLWGLEEKSFWRALLFGAQSTTSLFKTQDEPALEPVGQALQLPLRLLGPLFFGLALLSLRGRVKR